MNKALLLPEVQKFIRSFQGDISALAFKGSPFPGITVQELIQQVEGFQRMKRKLPSWCETEGIYFPPKMNLEQTSSEMTARYKASLISGGVMADITGGLGVDSFYFAENFDRVDHFEVNSELSHIAKHNFKVFQRDHVQCYNEDGLAALVENRYDFIYVDPARRHEAKGKVFFLKDCKPDVITYLEKLRTSCTTLLIKTSPMLDISVGMNELEGVFEIHIVAVDNEVKELLWFIHNKSESMPLIKTINFQKGKRQTFDFEYGGVSQATYSLPSNYLYEPNAAILKSGGFSQISENLNVDKLHLHSHLYTSKAIIDFPGRTFRITEVLPYRKQEMKKNLLGAKANITTRNFPEGVRGLRKKWKIADGGDQYLFFTTNKNDDKVVLVCEKLNP
ncbi:MAG: class I SAM-dependent methyltransferase [Bacteroidota bacterium]